MQNIPHSLLSDLGLALCGWSPLAFTDPGDPLNSRASRTPESSCIWALLDNNHWWPLGERCQVQSKEKEQSCLTRTQ